MLLGFLITCLASLCFVIASTASPRDKYRESTELLPDMVKSMTQSLGKEPTCDELRAMWRFSKRQSRAAVGANEVPTYRDPFTYNVWEDHANTRSVKGRKMRRPLVYGRLVHSGYQWPIIREAVPGRIKGFEDIARVFDSVDMPDMHDGRKQPTIRLVGGNDLAQLRMKNAHKDSFQHLKELIQSERSRELHAQKMSEEFVTRGSNTHRRRVMPQDLTAQVPNILYPRSRLDPFDDNFSDVLALPQNNYNYMQRAYPDHLILSKGAAKRY